MIKEEGLAGVNKAAGLLLILDKLEKFILENSNDPEETKDKIIKIIRNKDFAAPGLNEPKPFREFCRECGIELDQER